MKTLTLLACIFSALCSSATNYFGIKPIVNEPNCYGDNTGSIQLSIQGGIAPFQYAWSDGLPATQSQNNLSAGSYTVTVTDANSATATYSVVISQPFAMIVSGHVTVNGGNGLALSIAVDGGTPEYTYNWSNGATTQNISGLSPGTYTVTITDEVGCTTTVSKTIVQPPVHYEAPINSEKPKTLNAYTTVDMEDAQK